MGTSERPQTSGHPVVMAAAERLSHRYDQLVVRLVAEALYAHIEAADPDDVILVHLWEQGRRMNLEGRRPPDEAVEALWYALREMYRESAGGLGTQEDPPPGAGG